jgi:hypothetical protein
MSESRINYSGPGVLSILGIIFITLKVVEVEPIAGWSWWLVLSPFLIQLGVIGVILLGALLIHLVIN